MTKIEILNEAVKRTGRKDIKNVDVEVNAVLTDITTRFDFLKSYKTFSLTAGKGEYKCISEIGLVGLKRILDIRDENYNEVKKAENERIFFEFRRTATGTTPQMWYVFDKLENNNYEKVLWIYPVSNSPQNITIYYSFVHPIQDTILLPDTFKECIIEGVCYEIYKGLDMANQGLPHLQAYEKLLSSLYLSENDNVYIVQPQEK